MRRVVRRIPGAHADDRVSSRRGVRERNLGGVKLDSVRLLVLIGGNMLREALSKDEEKETNKMDVRTMFMLAVATSIDALAVGVTFACVPVELFSGNQLLNTVCAVLIIGVTTFAISCGGVKAGGVFGTKYKTKAEAAGGVILILIGVKILLEHFGIL